MIKLSNGHTFRYMTASGAMGYDGRGWPHEQLLRWLRLIDVSLFTHAMKTITLQPREGNFRWYNPFGCVRFIWDGSKIVGVHNAFGLTNPGYWWWHKKVGPKIDRSKIAVIGSIFGEPDEVAVMAKAMNDFDLVALELNASCPNAKDDTLTNTEKVIRSSEIVAKNSRHPKLLKLSTVHNIDKIVPAVKGMFEAFDINSVPWSIVFPDRKSPLAKFGGGGVSGKIAQPYTWAFAERLQAMTDVPVIAPSPWDYEDIGRLRQKKFKAIAFGSVCLPYPCRPTSYVRRNMKRSGGS